MNLEDKFFGDTGEQCNHVDANKMHVLGICDDERKACFACSVDHKGRDEWAARGVTQCMEIFLDMECDVDRCVRIVGGQF